MKEHLPKVPFALLSELNNSKCRRVFFMCAYQNLNKMNKKTRRLARFIDYDLNAVLFICIVISIVSMFAYLMIYSYYRLFTSDYTPEWCNILPVTSVCLGLLSITIKVIFMVVREVIKSIYRF